MQRERVTETIYVFTSNEYVQVTAGAVQTSAGFVLIDTLLYPDETRQIKNFIEQRLNNRVRYIINTHHHADHTTGTSLFEGVQVISHRLCRELLNTRGRESLAGMQSGSSDMAPIELVLPDVVFDDRLMLTIGGKRFRLWHSPGHSPDSIVCLVEDDQVLFAADTVMAIPHFVDGSYDDFVQSLKNLLNLRFEAIIQGHGEVILRGEVETKLQSDIDYLERLSIAVDQALEASPEKVSRALESISVEACGKSRIMLNGAVRQLHRQNVAKLAESRRQQALLQTE